MKYNPFPLLNAALLQDRIKAGKRYFVRQTYSRAMEPGIRASFLFRAYDATEKSVADEHLQLLHEDPHAFLYDVTIKEQLEKLNIAAQQPPGFRIYYAGKKGIDWKPPQIYQEKIKHYIRRNHPAWKPEKGGDKIRAGLSEEFGALFLTFSFGDEEDRILFDEIEKY
jgi:hypothetical protein